jgi:hypothetical protein
VLEVLACPETDDFDQELASRVQPVAKQKIGEDEARAGAQRLRLSDDVPLGRCLPELSGKSFLQLAVEAPPLLGNGHWVAYGEHEVESLTPHHAGGVQRESTGRDQWRYDRGQSTALEKDAGRHDAQGGHAGPRDGAESDVGLAASGGEHDDAASSSSLPCFQCASLVVSQLGTREHNVRFSDG